MTEQTGNIEQDRAEFEREMAAIFTHTDFELHPAGHYNNPITGTWLLIWQAARRAHNINAAAQAQRAPLSVVEAMKLGFEAQEKCKKHGTGTTNWACAMTRFYERAHGITQEKQGC